ncbi:hypothetical protein [Stenotrophomonas maltophilia]
MTWRFLEGNDPHSDAFISLTADLISPPSALESWVGFSGRYTDGYSQAEASVSLSRDEDGRLVLSGDNDFGPYIVRGPKVLAEGEHVVLDHATKGFSYEYEITQVKPLK